MSVLALSLCACSPDTSLLTDCKGWTQRTLSTSPPKRRDHAMAYDSTRQRVVLFGGLDNSSYLSYLADTWEWDWDGGP